MRYWLSWEERSRDYRPITDPPGAAVLGWWCSGEAGDGSYSAMCALVDAADEDTAKAAIGLDWPEVDALGQPCARVWRFAHVVSADWLPGDRFPLSAWSLKRVEP